MRCALARTLHSNPTSSASGRVRPPGAARLLRSNMRLRLSEFFGSDTPEQTFDSIQRFLQPAPLLIVIAGPSGVGKDSVVAGLRESGCPFHFVVTATDRAPRVGEVQGQDYYFVSTNEFERMIAEGELFEHALVYDQYKGVPKAHARQALASGRDVVMRLDVQGATTIKRLLPAAITVFLAPPSSQVLLDRLSRRGGDTPEQVQHRLEMALAEMATLDTFDYVVINREGKLTEAVQQILAIISAEKCRTHRVELCF
jgi:guanylate kinase